MAKTLAKNPTIPAVQVVDKVPADVLDEIEAAVHACVTSIMNGIDFLL